jgi:hypothetical protein
LAIGFGEYLIAIVAIEVAWAKVSTCENALQGYVAVGARRRSEAGPEIMR